MGVGAVTGTASSGVYSGYEKEQTGKTAEKTAESKETKAAEKAAVYEKSESKEKTDATYSVNKMSKSERAALVDQLKADQAAREQSLLKIVRQMVSGQGKAYSIASGDKSLWRVLASGEFTVDAATKSQAQADIAEDGYWGVKQTSQRLFDFASALAGDDVEKMKEMQKAMEKGFKMATGTWGRELPGICKDTMDAARQLFEDYYASKE